ncbi:MAG: integrase core domain-containing protein [Alphaproteobacteria bacterium]|nr:integrase core domain-containing protein [Alphaproteobacteria bacterium]MBQ3945896.1 integrase core domain-containing protein [Alphaproteobacteria bacterium]
MSPKALGMPFFVLPPAKPTHNGKIERSNRVFREEFYEELSANSIVGASGELAENSNNFCQNTTPIVHTLPRTD